MKKKLEKHNRRMFYRKLNAFGAQGRNDKANSGPVPITPFSYVSVFKSLRFRIFLNRSHYSSLLRFRQDSLARKRRCSHYSVFVRFHFLCSDSSVCFNPINYALILAPSRLLLLYRFRKTPFSLFPLELSVFERLRFRKTPVWCRMTPFSSVLMGTQNQKRIHSTPFSYENGVMGTGPKSTTLEQTPCTIL